MVSLLPKLDFELPWHFKIYFSSVDMIVQTKRHVFKRHGSLK